MVPYFVLTKRKKGIIFMKKIEFKPTGVCARQIDVEVDNGIVTSIAFTGGCNGNLKGLSALAIGRTTDEVIKILEGTTCGSKPTSCPDQLCKALREASC